MSPSAVPSQIRVRTIPPRSHLEVVRGELPSGRRWRRGLGIGSCLLIGVLLLGAPRLGASAQDSEGEWSDPTNLSQSGGTADPHIVAAADGALIVVWDDAFSGSGTRGLMAGYSQLGTDTWLPAAPADLPFAGRSPQLVVGLGNAVHAIWIDSGGFLRHGASTTSSFGDGSRWGAQVIASSVIAFDAAIDAQGRIHLICLMADERQQVAAGVYYLRSGLRGDTWSAPSAIYLSDYFRTFLPNAPSGASISSDAPAAPHVDIEVSESSDGPWVFLAWDNPSLRRIYLATSQDAGGTWGAPAEIAGPNLASPYSSPQQIQVSANGDHILLLWQIAEAGGACDQLSQSSSDGGASWSDPAPVIEDATGCLENIQVLGGEEEATLIFADFQGRATLLAWDGQAWSLPQSQPALDYFTDGLTFGLVEFGCRQAALAAGELYVVGCGTGSGGSDVWLTSRTIGDISAWFEPSTGWTEIGSASVLPEEILSLAAASNDRGAVFAVWSQPEAATSETVTSDLYYAGWNGTDVIGPFPVLRQLPGLAAQLQILVDDEGRLLMVWSGGESGELNFSWASDEEVASDSGWVSPVSIPRPGVLGQSPHLLEATPGSIYLAYAVPFNESRGVYLTTSEEPDLVWGDPVMVFGAAGAGCEAVEQTSLTQGLDGTLHLAWVCASLPGGIGPLALFHSRSEDGGTTWSEPARAFERRAVWGRIATDGIGTLHLVWQEHLTGRINTWDALSRDGGENWEEPLSVSVVDGAAGYASLASDRSGRLHLLQTVQETGSTPEVQYTEWNGQAWTEREALRLKVDSLDDLGGIAFTVGQDASLVAVYIGRSPRAAQGLQDNTLRFESIPLGPAQTPTVERTPAATHAAAETPPPATSTPSVRLAVGPDSQPPAGGSLGIIAGVVTAIVLVVGIVYARVRLSNPGKRA